MTNIITSQIVLLVLLDDEDERTAVLRNSRTSVTATLRHIC
jgi:hypothetical protein